MEKYYALLSGEHRELPVGELKGILEAESLKYNIEEVLDQLVIFSVEKLEPSIIVERAGMIREVGLFTFKIESPLKNSEVMLRVREVDWGKLVFQSRFLVRGKRIKEYLKNLNIPELEKKIGEAILNSTLGRVDVKTPEVTIRFFLTSNSLVLGVQKVRADFKQFSLRRPRKRPFFHPEALDPKLSRVFVNLARARKEKLLVDPFCGTGSILLEGGIIGVKVLGLDVRRDMVEGCLKNLKAYNVNPVGVIRADATKPPLRRADSIATDPPYGRASTTLGRSVKELVYEFTSVWAEVLPQKSHICYAIPHTIDYTETFPKREYKLKELYTLRVHKSLSRNIIVLERV